MYNHVLQITAPEMAAREHLGVNDPLRQNPHTTKGHPNQPPGNDNLLLVGS